MFNIQRTLCLYTSINILVILGFIMTVSSAYALDFVVVKGAAGAVYKPGDVLSDTTSITVDVDNSLTLIDAQGRKLLIKGPVSGTLAALSAQQNENGDTKTELGFGLSSNVIGALSSLLKNKKLNSVSVGAFRSLAAGDPSTDPWAIDVSQADDHCIQEGRSATFWRSDASTQDNLSLEATNGTEKANINWPAESEQIEWPLEVALNDGGDYKMQTSDSKNNSLIVHMVPDNLPTRAHQAAWMAERKCEQQALLLVLTAEIDALVDELAKDGQF